MPRRTITSLAQPSRELNISVLANALLQCERDYSHCKPSLIIFHGFPSISRVRILNPSWALNICSYRTKILIWNIKVTFQTTIEWNLKCYKLTSLSLYDIFKDLFYFSIVWSMSWGILQARRRPKTENKQKRLYHLAECRENCLAVLLLIQTLHSCLSTCLQ